MRMTRFIGTKVILARSMSRQEYSDYRGWVLPANENGADEGMLVEYVDGGKANDPRHTGYISWSPLDVFLNAYRTMDAMAFGDAVHMLKEGKHVARAGWNGKGMWLALVKSMPQPVAQLAYCVDGGDHFFSGGMREFIAMRTVDDQFVPWVASQTDVLADDWVVV